MKARGSDDLLTVVVEPFAFLKNPLGPRLSKLGDKPITFMYGAFDWMERATAEKLC